LTSKASTPVGPVFVRHHFEPSEEEEEEEEVVVVVVEEEEEEEEEELAGNIFGRSPIMACLIFFSF
jgi:hypothetical protein